MIGNSTDYKTTKYKVAMTAGIAQLVHESNAKP